MCVIFVQGPEEKPHKIHRTWGTGKVSILGEAVSFLLISPKQLLIHF